MPRLIAVLLTLFMITGCVGMKRVEGDQLYFSPSAVFKVDSSFQYIGTVTTSYTNQNVDSIKTSTHREHWEIFIKTYKDTNEVSELVVAFWDILPDRTRYINPGTKPDLFFTEKISRYKSVEKYLNSKGYTTSSTFNVGIFNQQIEGNTMRFIALAVATSVTPSGASIQEYLTNLYPKYISPMSSDSQTTHPQN